MKKIKAAVLVIFALSSLSIDCSEKEERLAQYRRGFIEGIFLGAANNLLPTFAQHDGLGNFLKSLVALVGLSVGDVIAPVPMFPGKHKHESLPQPTLISPVVRIGGFIFGYATSELFLVSVIYLGTKIMIPSTRELHMGRINFDNNFLIKLLVKLFEDEEKFYPKH